jgi:hypothetical protein
VEGERVDPELAGQLVEAHAGLVPGVGLHLDVYVLGVPDRRPLPWVVELVRRARRIEWLPSGTGPGFGNDLVVEDVNGRVYVLAVPRQHRSTRTVLRRQRAS